MKEKVLEIKELTKYYGETLGVKKLSLNLENGEIFGFIGPNGSGKSTTIRCVMNLINKTEGSVYFLGKILNKENKSLKEKIGYLPSEINLYEDFTVKEMLDYHEKFFKKSIHKRRLELVEKLKLDENKVIEDLSLGNLKKLGIVLAFMHEPKLLILDEPTSGLDPIIQQEFFNLLKEERKKGTTIFYSTHILSEIVKICDRVGIIKDGNLLKIETIDEIFNKNFTYVTLESNDVDSIIRNLKLNVEKKEDMKIKFKNEMSPNILINELAKYKIDKILIEEASIEDILLHYYK